MASTAVVPTTISRPLFGVDFTKASIDELLQAVVGVPENGQGVRLIVTANVDHIVRLRNTPALRAAYRHAWARTIDGTPVYLYAALRGAGVPGRVTGSDLFARLMDRLDASRHRPFFVIANDIIAQGLARWAEANGFANKVDIVIPPFGFERDAAFGEALAAQIRAHETTHLFFGVGCPRSETWIDAHRDQLGDCYSFAVGAAIGFYVGAQRRAPQFARQFGLEWLWRMLSEPRRLSKRYLIQSWAFFKAIREDLLRRPCERS